jgi:hypothetical protein
MIHLEISFALSLEFFNNLIFVKFGKILTKYDQPRLMPILLFVLTFATPAAYGDLLRIGFIKLPDWHNT